jgi:hypothetical protein
LMAIHHVPPPYYPISPIQHSYTFYSLPTPGYLTSKDVNTLTSKPSAISTPSAYYPSFIIN